MKDKLKLWKDILTETSNGITSYSQARVYLLWSIIAYFIALAFMTFKSFKLAEVDTKPLEMVISALQFTLILFSSYALGTKGIELIKHITNVKNQGAIPTDVPPVPEDNNQDSPK